MCERLRYLSWWQKIILAVASLGLLAHFSVSVARVGHKIGDYDINREFGRRFLAGEPLYQGGHQRLLLGALGTGASPRRYGSALFDGFSVPVHHDPNS